MRNASQRASRVVSGTRRDTDADTHTDSLKPLSTPVLDDLLGLGEHETVHTWAMGWEGRQQSKDKAKGGQDGMNAGCKRAG